VKFDLQEPHCLEEAASLVSKYGEDSRVIAGGQSLLPMIRTGLVRPSVLISLGLVKDLEAVKAASAGSFQLGALTTHRQILRSSLVKEQAGILAEAVSRIGSTPVRNFGTIGGNICHNEMGSDPPSALLVLNAEVECLSVRGRRKMPVSDFLTGYFETCLAADEILTGIEVPAAPADSTGIYLKHAIRPGDLAIVGVAALLGPGNGGAREARIAVGGVGPVPFRVTEAEKLLRENKISDELIEAAAAAAAAMADPLSDAHASADYRRKMVRVFVTRAIKQAVADTPVDKR
jgi:aerobic carbon-monoxide dehydrogenase medium subunit